MRWNDSLKCSRGGPLMLIVGASSVAVAYLKLSEHTQVELKWQWVNVDGVISDLNVCSKTPKPDKFALYYFKKIFDEKFLIWHEAVSTFLFLQYNN